MLLTRRLRLINPLLANRNNHGRNPYPNKVFTRVNTPRNQPEGRAYIASDLPRWEWAFLEARDALSLSDVAVSAIVPPRWYAVANTKVFNRRYRYGSSMRTESHESLSANQVFEAVFTLSAHVPPNTDGNGRFIRPPDEQEFDDMLSHIGEHLGMSEWGHGRQFGRFEISLLTKPQETPTNGDPTPAGDAGDTDRETDSAAEVHHSQGRGGDDGDPGPP